MEIRFSMPLHLLAVIRAYPSVNEEDCHSWYQNSTFKKVILGLLFAAKQRWQNCVPNLIFSCLPLGERKSQQIQFPQSRMKLIFAHFWYLLCWQRRCCYVTYHWSNYWQNIKIHSYLVSLRDAGITQRLSADKSKACSSWLKQNVALLKSSIKNHFDFTTCHLLCVFRFGSLCTSRVTNVLCLESHESNCGGGTVEQLSAASSSLSAIVGKQRQLYSLIKQYEALLQHFYYSLFKIN